MVFETKQLLELGDLQLQDVHPVLQTLDDLVFLFQLVQLRRVSLGFLVAFAPFSQAFGVGRARVVPSVDWRQSSSALGNGEASDLLANYLELWRFGSGLAF